MNKISLVLTGGYFNPLTVGHVRLFQAAAEHGNLIVAVSSEEMSIKKSGFSFMPLGARMEIIRSINGVGGVMVNYEENMVNIIRSIKPDLYVKGGPVDFYTLNKDEIAACYDINCAILFGVGGKEKVASSSELIQNAYLNMRS